MSQDPKHPLFWVAPLLFGTILFAPFTHATRSPAPVLVQAGEHTVPVQTSFATSTSARVLVGGDMLFDRSIRSTMDAKGGDFIFSCIDDTLKGADLVVANLEGPITDNGSMSLGSVPNTPANYVFTFPPETAALLAAHNIRIVNLGNNHILNFGVAGEAATKQYLRLAGVEYFGDPTEQTVAYESVNGVNLAFINYNEFAPGNAFGAYSASTTVAQIKDVRSAGFLPIVYTHWGIEYATTSPVRVQALAHAFVDAGAEIVIGSHPHVVEQWEVYKNKYIYYSLGNFIFDQYFLPQVQHGLLLSLTIDPAGITAIREIPIVLHTDRRTCVE